MNLTEILERAAAGDLLSEAELKFLLELEAPEDLARLYRTAYAVKLHYIDNRVRLRGLIEISNLCRKDCFYCGIRRSNAHVNRFAMTLDEIVAAARHAVEFHYGSVVLQSGERHDPAFVDFIEEAVRRIKALPGNLGITLSVGEQSEAVYRRWLEAGAHRYLLRIEASNPALYAKLHPADHRYEERLDSLRKLREVGYQVGTGVMIGLPHQSVDDLVHDIEFFRKLDVDMIGMGPYIPHHETPLGREFPEYGERPERQLELGLKMIAVTRLQLKDVNIASTTALQALAPDGRERGLLAGANVIMPNIGEVAYRQGYLLYENKPGTDENAQLVREKLEQAIASIGETIAYDQWGDSRHFARRNGADDGMPDRAHRDSAAAVVDPAWSVETPVPEGAAPAGWLYPPCEYERFLLQKMRREVALMKLNVGYPGSFRRPSTICWFRRRVRPEELLLRTSGTLSATLDGTPLAATMQSDGVFRLHPEREGTLLLRVETGSDGELLPGILPLPPLGWEASSDGVHFETALPGGDPAGDPLPTLRLTAEEYAPGRYDFGRELIGTVRIHCETRPEFGFGESTFERENRDPARSEQSLELVEVAPGCWETPGALAFRYLRVEAPAPVQVECDAEFTPECYRGAFAADAELNRIWMCSAYTLRLCIRHFLIDGIKRDRLPWAGDLALSLLANAYTFADPEPVRRTLTILGDAGIEEQHVNGATDYTLWLLICHDLYLRYFEDPAFLERLYPGIAAMIDRLLESSSPFLPPGSWVFIDWVTSRQEPGRGWNSEEKESALQILFFQALEAAARLAERRQDTRLAERCRKRAGELKESLLRGFDARRGLFPANPARPELGFYRHANILAVLSGLVEPAMARAIMEKLCDDELPPVGTPYQAALEILAFHRAGLHETALARLRKIWGGMLRLGATTFFEAYDASQTGNERYAFYQRPYGLSLCHAWSAGPAALLPILFFGCEPAADGWRTFRIAPSPLCRGKEAATIPTPAGAIRLWREEGRLRKEFPPEITPEEPRSTGHPVRRDG